MAGPDNNNDQGAQVSSPAMEITDFLPSMELPELLPVAEFLQQSLPFDELPAELLYPTVSKIIISYHIRGEYFDGKTQEKGLRIVRNGAVELRDSDNKLLDNRTTCPRSITIKAFITDIRRGRPYIYS